MCWKEYHTQEQCYERRTQGQWQDASQPAKLSGHAQITLYPWKLNIIGLSCYAKSKDNNITTCAYTYGFKHNQSCGKSCRIYVDKHYNSHTSFLAIYSVYILTSSWRRKRWSRRRVNVDASCHGRALWCTVRPLGAWRGTWTRKKRNERKSRPRGEYRCSSTRRGLRSEFAEHCVATRYRSLRLYWSGRMVAGYESSSG